MSRTDAKNKLDLATEQKRMEGIIHTLRSQGGLDEAPGAYKDIESVMAQQTDLVRPVVKLLPLVSIKPLKG